jgi:hypothetical protein
MWFYPFSLITLSSYAVFKVQARFCGFHRAIFVVRKKQLKTNISLPVGFIFSFPAASAASGSPNDARRTPNHEF